MTTRRGFLGMLGGAAAAAIAAPVLAKVAPTEDEIWTAWYDHVLNAYMRPAMLAIANDIDRDLLAFHGVTRFEPTPFIKIRARRFDDPCSTDVNFSVRSLAL